MHQIFLIKAGEQNLVRIYRGEKVTVSLEQWQYLHWEHLQIIFETEGTKASVSAWKIRWEHMEVANGWYLYEKIMEDHPWDISDEEWPKLRRDYQFDSDTFIEERKHALQPRTNKGGREKQSLLIRRRRST